MNVLLQQGISAYCAGQRDEARKLLITAVKQDLNSEQAWDWLYLVANNDQERLDCVHQILRINPQNEKAKGLLDRLNNVTPPPVSPTEDDKPKNSPENEKAIRIRQYIMIVTGMVLFIPVTLVVETMFHTDRYTLLVPAAMQISIGISAIKNRILFAKMRGEKDYVRDEQAVLFGQLFFLTGIAVTIYAFIPLLLDAFLPYTNYLPASTAPGGFTTAFILAQNTWNASRDYRVLQVAAVAVLGAGIGGIVWTWMCAARNRPFPTIATQLAVMGVLMGILGLYMIEDRQSPLLRDCAALQNQYDSQEYNITEGVVHVHHTQPLGGHAAGDLITVGDDGNQFEVDYYSLTCAYKTTLAWGGILTENAYARIYSTSGGAILRIDLRDQ